MFCAVSSAKSPRIVPGAASCGRVAPLIARTTAIAFGPSSASATSGAGDDELDEPGEERLLAVRRVVALGEVAVDADQLEPDELEAAFLVAREDPADQLALDAVGLDEDEGSFGAWHVYLGYGRAGRAGLYRMGRGRVESGDCRRSRPCGSATSAASASGVAGHGRLGRVVGRVGGSSRADRRPRPDRARASARRRASAGTRSARRPARSGPRPPASTAARSAFLRARARALGQTAPGRHRRRPAGPRRLVAREPVGVAAHHRDAGAAGTLGRLEDRRREGRCQRAAPARSGAPPRSSAPATNAVRPASSSAAASGPDMTAGSTSASPSQKPSMTGAAVDGSLTRSAATRSLGASGRTRRPAAEGRARDRTGSAPSAAARRHRPARRPSAASRRRSRRSCRRRTGQRPVGQPARLARAAEGGRRLGGDDQRDHRAVLLARAPRRPPRRRRAGRRSASGPRPGRPGPRASSSPRPASVSSSTRASASEPSRRCAWARTSSTVRDGVRCRPGHGRRGGHAGNRRRGSRPRR